MTKITFIYCFRDRELLRVKLSLDSLAVQDDSSFKVIFVDYGSEEQLAHEVEKLVASYPFVKYLYNDTRGMMWNRSQALNTAIKIADTPYIFTSDIDMIYKEGFVKMLNASAEAGKAFFFSGMMLPEGVLPGNHENEKKYKCTDDQAMGWGMIPTQALFDLHGYDEVFCIWGREDNDIGNRLRSSGISVEYISEIWMYHYYHPPVPQQRAVLPEDWFSFLKDYNRYVVHQLQRNSEGWGQLYNTDDRAAYQLLTDPEAKYTPVEGRARFFRYLVEQKFEDAPKGTALKFVFHDRVESVYRSSFIFRFAGWLNKTFRKLRIPFLVSSYFAADFEDIYVGRNELMYLLITRMRNIADYAYELEGNSIRVVIIKK